MKKKPIEWNVVDILNHSRHDWLNKLQLIKGNLSLQKYDRVNDIIKEVIIEAQQETKLCNLKMSLFASYLMTFNWSNHHFVLEYEILGDSLSLETYDTIVTEWCTAFFELLDQAVDISSENHLGITIDIHSDDEEIRFFFDFNGIIKDTDQLIDWLKAVDHSELIMDEIQVDTYELTTVFSLRT